MFAWVSITIMITVTCLLMEKEIFKFKADNKSVKVPIQFCLGNISNGFGGPESRDVSLKGNAYDSSIDFNAIDKSEIHNIHNYLMIKNNVQ